MAFPVVSSVANSNDTANTLSRNATLPASIVAGNLIVAFIAADLASSATTITMPAGWTDKATQQFGSVVRCSVFARVADGTEGATVTITTSASEACAWHFYNISSWFGAAAGCEVGTPAAAGSTNPDPPSLTPSWGAADTLWLAGAGNDGNVAVTAGPASYTNFVNTRWANTAGCGVSSARRELNTATENPGVFTMTTEQWVAHTVAIRPAAAGGGGSTQPPRTMHQFRQRGA
jgi:hypothetical protein